MGMCGFEPSKGIGIERRSRIYYSDEFPKLFSRTFITGIMIDSSFLCFVYNSSSYSSMQETNFQVDNFVKRKKVSKCDNELIRYIFCISLEVMIVI